MIMSFRCADTRAFFEGEFIARFQSIKMVAERKLQMLDSAETLDFLRSPPGNCLQALKGTRKGQYSIRINKQWRICFVWTDEGPTQVEIVDYH